MPREAGIARGNLCALTSIGAAGPSGVEEAEPGGEPVEETHRRGHPPP